MCKGFRYWALHGAMTSSLPQPRSDRKTFEETTTGASWNRPPERGRRRFPSRTDLKIDSIMASATYVKLFTSVLEMNASSNTAAGTETKTSGTLILKVVEQPVSFDRQNGLTYSSYGLILPTNAPINVVVPDERKRQTRYQEPKICFLNGFESAGALEVRHQNDKNVHLWTVVQRTTSILHQYFSETAKLRAGSQFFHTQNRPIIRTVI
jgi:hypothetical protein